MVGTNLWLFQWNFFGICQWRCQALALAIGEFGAIRCFCLPCASLGEGWALENNECEESAKLEDYTSGRAVTLHKMFQAFPVNQAFGFRNIASSQGWSHPEIRETPSRLIPVAAITKCKLWSGFVPSEWLSRGGVKQQNMELFILLVFFPYVFGMFDDSGHFFAMIVVGPFQVPRHQTRQMRVLRRVIPNTA